MLKLRPKMFDESAKSHASKELWRLVLYFIAVFIVIVAAESLIPSIVTSKPMQDAINEELSISGEKKVTFSQSMKIATEISSRPKIMITSLLCTVFGTLISIFYCRFFEMRRVTSMGVRWNKGKAVVHYGTGVVVGILMMSAITLLSVVCGANSIKQLDDINYGLIALYLFAFLVQGMSEEFIFRGYLMTTVGANHSTVTAISVSAVTFGCAHLANPGVTPLAFINLILYGVFAALYMIYFDDIWGVCGIHSLWNFSQGNIFGISVSGTSKSESFVRTYQKSSNAALTGGKFGIEGSIFTTIVLAAGITIMLVLHQRRERMTVPVQAETVETTETTEDTSENQ